MSDTLEAPKTETGKGLAVIADLTPEIFNAEKAKEIVGNLRAEIMLIDRDVSTKKGREAIASMAAKIARSKTAADAFGKNLKAEYKAKVDAIDGIRRIFWDGLEALQKEFRQPLTEFEEREKARVAGHEAALADIARLPFFDGTPLTDAIADRLTIAQAVDVSTFEEFAARAEAAKADAVSKLEAMLAESRKRDEERAELERLRQEAAEREAREAKEKAEREQKERETRAADEAKREAEEKAAQALKQAEAEKAEAEARAAQAEADRLAAIEQAKRDAEAAVEQERRRAEAQKRAEEEATRKREQDKAHRGRVNSAAMRAIITAMADAHSGNAAEAEVIARAIVTAIAKGAVPAVKISY